MLRLRRSSPRSRASLLWVLITCALLALVAVLLLRLGNERQRHAEEIRTLKTDRAALRQEIAERQAASGSLADLKAEIGRAEARERTVGQAARETEAQVAGLEARRKAAEEAIAAAASLQTDLSAARAKVDGALRESDDLQQQLTASRADRDRLSAAIALLEQKRAELEAEVSALDAKRAGGMEELAKLDGLLERTRREVSEAQARAANGHREALGQAEPAKTTPPDASGEDPGAPGTR
ncbi:hypothetical protein [Methylobacterium gregans]|uniref:Chromosome partition protein Smc n=1 Tax=Methylobacterium gregans TaxID=374424 RepID=A0AA37HKR5_9HYPH|nr:hypothetical protein [Methylobacterium gregans]MDQ0523390.1 chromosome segregation ATPase [Methylobacterium gregans]GJD77255.1 Chromosome partition protein Smc [Methylobacterium gregans]GLS56015.1 hypothetical protein GCM10007886_42000 [Methylobacterium gregans]